MSLIFITTTEILSLEQVLLLVSFVVCLGYGCFLTLAIFTLHAMLRKGFPTSRARRFLLATVAAFLILSTLFCVTSLLQVYKAAGPNGIMGAAFEGIFSSKWTPAAQDFLVKWEVSTVTACIIYVLNDGIVAWRAWAVADHFLFRALLIVSLLLTIVCVAVDEQQFFIVMTKKFITQQNFSPFSDLLVYVPILFTNLTTTLIIFWKTWMYRKEVNAYLERGNENQVQVQRILFLLIESGFVYCGLWILFIVVNWCSSIPFALVIVISDFMPFIAATYPMAIILVIEYQNSSPKSSRNSPPNDPESYIQFASPFSDSSLDEMYPGPKRDVSIVQSIADHIHMRSCRQLEDSQGVQVDVRPVEREGRGKGDIRDVSRSSVGIQATFPV